MYYYITALYIEAAPIIESLGLKKNNKITKFQIFENETTVLIITQPGKINAAIATTYLFTIYEPTPLDIVINIGCCGCNDTLQTLGTICFCNKIMDNDTSRCYYPDLLYRHPFIETSLTTCSTIASFDTRSLSPSKNMELFDMEASAIIETCSHFVKPHQLLIVKLITDHLNKAQLQKEMVQSLVKEKFGMVLDFIHSLRISTSTPIKLSTEDLEKISLISHNLKLSTTLYYQLQQLFLYYKLQGNSVNELLHQISIDEQYLSCTSKREGIRYVKRLKTFIIS